MSRHEFDPVSLIAGVLFAAIGLVYLTIGDSGSHVSGRAVLALGVTGLGVAGLAGAIRRLRGPARDANRPPVADAAAPPTWPSTVVGEPHPAPATERPDPDAGTLRFSTDKDRDESASTPTPPGAGESGASPDDHQEHHPDS